MLHLMIRIHSINCYLSVNAHLYTFMKRIEFAFWWANALFKITDNHHNKDLFLLTCLEIEADNDSASSTNNIQDRCVIRTRKEG